jgi:hypothetical protein
MSLALILFASMVADGPCTGPDISELANLASLPGDYVASPALPELQPYMMKRLAHQSLVPIDETVARTATGNQNLAKRQHYYLARVGYLGAWTADMKGRNPLDIDLTLQVDADGVGYVTSRLLSRDNGVGEFAAVLASATPLKRIVSSCDAAT